MTSLIYHAKDIYAKYLEKEYGEPRGCNEIDIKILENEFMCSLPKAYKQYLSWMGKDIDGVFRGSEWFYGSVISNTGLLPELLKENGITFEHEGKPLCFFSHQGYMAGWFYLPCDDSDPQCYFFSEGLSPARVEGVGKFSDFLLNDLMGPVRRCLAR